MKHQKEQKILSMLEPLVDQVGVCDLQQPISLETYKKWLDQGMQGNMHFLKEHLPQKEDPRCIDRNLKSAIVISKDYFPHPKPMDLGFESEKTPGLMNIGAYAKGQDYHHWLKQLLDSVIEKLQEEFPNEVFLSFTDSGPVLERDLAYRAGLGWVGKNTCLIHPQKGSLFFIGEILSSIDIKFTQDLVPDRCGTCTRCIDACPTDALSERSLDARKCISYLTIEHKSEVSPDLAKNFQSWFYGCDICQSVCPWNEKVFGKAALEPIKPKPTAGLSNEDRDVLVSDLQSVLESSNKALAKRFRGSPLTRANGNMHKRNAMIVAVNYELKELEASIRSLLESSTSDFVKNTAKWYLKQEFLDDL